MENLENLARAMPTSVKPTAETIIYIPREDGIEEVRIEEPQPKARYAGWSGDCRSRYTPPYRSGLPRYISGQSR